MRSFILLTVLLAGCASDRISDCTKLAGAGWTTLGQPPPNAEQLMALENIPTDSQTVWLSKGQDKLLACYYARGLTSPGCGGSSAYEFQQKNGRWSSRGAFLDTCELGPD